MLPDNPYPQLTQTSGFWPGPTKAGSDPAAALNPYGPSYVPVPKDTRFLSLRIVSGHVGDIPAAPASNPAVVGAMSAKSNALVTPPEGEGKKGADWNRTTVWIRESAYPSYPNHGTTYIYGHACLGAICPFSAVKRLPDGSFTVAPRDLVQVATLEGRLVYEVTTVGSAPKRDNGPLPSWASDGTVPDRLVLVTCEYVDGRSDLNIIIVAKLVAATRV